MNSSKLPIDQFEVTLNEALFYRDEFLAIASHELKTPLTSLKLQCQLFKRTSAKGVDSIYSKEKVDRLIEMTDLHVTRLTRLIDDMLDISRIRTGKLTISKDTFNLNHMLSDLLMKMDQTFTSYGQARPKLESNEDIYLIADKQRIEQVIRNLLSNALKYGRRKPIQLKLELQKSCVRILVIDQGIGIAKELHEKVFHRFQRAVPASEVSGMGLGLFISREIIEAHGGRIYLESALNVGSTFIIEIPVVEGK